MERPPLNGGTLVMALPVFKRNSTEEIREFVVVIKLDRSQSAHPYVCTTVPSLDSPTWGQGSYFVSLSLAMIEAYDRIGVAVLS